jgi:hypothetical protein
MDKLDELYTAAIQTLAAEIVYTDAVIKLTRRLVLLKLSDLDTPKLKTCLFVLTVKISKTGELLPWEKKVLERLKKELDRREK